MPYKRCLRPIIPLYAISPLIFYSQLGVLGNLVELCGPVFYGYCPDTSMMIQATFTYIPFSGFFCFLLTD
jgi:hypothetical protein